MSRTPMDKHWGDRENRCYGGSSCGNTSLVVTALHLAERSAVTALEPVIFEQEPRVLILCWVLRIVPCPVLLLSRVWGEYTVKDIRLPLEWK